ncbi:Uu.00g141500.m01.CDS01 [Anthostomella pinea]|uniref:Uu.00g141500.m01.CDS01 n=1 Tax=Anthostomella pinea TaxID=933095 RepID=A0AAI8YLI3_9PEZI|nr:Uu.00g141500.m01.CDS01 [Anthostomella pinea]
MASIKASLKTINDAIRQQKWDEALAQAENVINKDPKNYQAYVFKAFALDKQNKLDLAEDAYKTATDIRPDAQAWQGLVKLYEKQGAKTLRQYQHAALKLAEIFRDANEMHKCQDVVDKFIDYARAQGDRSQYTQALNLILPDSPIYPALEGRVPHPAKTYETIAQILEIDEKKRINTLIGERRTRLGAKISKVTLEVNREVLGHSKLGEIYEQLTLWSHDDDVRRHYEEKLLQFRYDRLLVTLPADKAAELKVVQKLANDMVIIKHPFKLAWDIAIEWQDHKEIKDWDVNVLNEYCAHFPDSDLYRVLTGFMTSDFSPFPKKIDEAAAPAPTAEGDGDDESEDDEEGGAPTSVIPYTDDDRLLMMTEGISTTNSVFAHRLMGEYYQQSEEHESNVELMRKAMKIMVAETEKTGKLFTNANQAFMLYLGTALVFYQSPRNHGEAKFLFDKVLEVDPTSTSAMIGVGLIYEEEEEIDQAIEFLDRALRGDSGNLRVRAEVGWLYALKGDYTRAKAELESLLPSMTSQSASKDLIAQTQHRLGCCIWNIDPSKAARKSRHGAYVFFLDALKSNFSYAPAYSSLGIYYADYAKDKKRARRCFLKAVELSSAEVESAERLARSFADDGDWDRVELVAQRVVDSGKVKPPPGSKKKGISWPLSALGVAELNKQNYAKAIVSFQQALRIAPEDYHSWVGLGESYHNSGRYIAATKAIQHAQKLETTTNAQAVNDTWFTEYMLANVKRELGEFDEAVSLYREVISSRSEEEGVAIALMQTMVENALDCVEKGLFGKSIELASETLSFALTVPESVADTFNFWKAVGDSCSVFSLVQSRVHDLPTEDIGKLLDLGTSPDSAYALLRDVDEVGKEVILAQGIFPDDEQLGVDLTRCLHATILAHKRAIHLSAQDIHAQAVAYYNLGWAENRAHMCLPSQLRVQSSRYQKAAVRCFKRAIELEAGNPDFWNSLGVVTSEINPSVAQHAFVRSLFLNERSPHGWTNLGALALLQNDVQLANEAFTRAQSNDPDYAHAWLGQGFVALLYGDSKEARGLLTHAMDISESSSLLTRRQYPTSLFDHILTCSASLDAISLIHPLFALTQLQRLSPQDIAYQHLLTLYQERTDDNSAAIATLEKACEKLEANYEATESAESLGRFALAKTDLARSYLAAAEYAKATECGELALQLSSDESANELPAEQRTEARLSAHLTMGLAEYFANRADAAVKYFETALEESSGNPDAACLLAQVLWATGTDKARERARTILFEVIDKDASHVQSVLLLGVVALLDDDEESLEAVVSELHTLRTSEKVTDTEHSHIGEIFRAVAALSENSTEADVIAQVQNDVMLYPHLPHGWSHLAQLSGEEYPADMALNVAMKAIPPRGELGAIDLADAYAGTGKVADAQTAIFIAPWTGNQTSKRESQLPAVFDFFSYCKGMSPITEVWWERIGPEGRENDAHKHVPNIVHFYAMSRKRYLESNPGGQTYSSVITRKGNFMIQELIDTWNRMTDGQTYWDPIEERRKVWLGKRGRDSEDGHYDQEDTTSGSVSPPKRQRLTLGGLATTVYMDTSDSEPRIPTIDKGKQREVASPPPSDDDSEESSLSPPPDSSDDAPGDSDDDAPGEPDDAPGESHPIPLHSKLSAVQLGDPLPVQPDPEPSDPFWAPVRQDPQSSRGGLRR